jgi:hypothetical protein
MRFAKAAFFSLFGLYIAGEKKNCLMLSVTTFPVFRANIIISLVRFGYIYKKTKLNLFLKDGGSVSGEAGSLRGNAVFFAGTVFCRYRPSYLLSLPGHPCGQERQTASRQSIYEEEMFNARLKPGKHIPFSFSLCFCSIRYAAGEWKESSGTKGGENMRKTGLDYTIWRNRFSHPFSFRP